MLIYFHLNIPLYFLFKSVLVKLYLIFEGVLNQYYQEKNKSLWINQKANIRIYTEVNQKSQGK